MSCARKAPVTLATAAMEKPRNVVLILADDLSWVGTSVQMHESVPTSRSDYYQTPALERLAKEGMRFSNAYAPHPNCSPTRLSIQIGMSPAKLRMTDIIDRSSGPNYEGNPLIPPTFIRQIPNELTTVAEWLKAADPTFRTAHFGKWHLAGGGPGKHGYDEHDGSTYNNQGDTDSPDDPKQIFSLTSRAVSFMERQVAEGRPFFLQISHYAVHIQIAARQRTISKYETSDRGVRHSHPAYAAMTEDLDSGISMVLDSIDELGIADNTYVVFTSDNGSYLKKGLSNLPLAGQKTQLLEGGIRVPMIIRGPGIEANSVSHVPVVGWDLFSTIRDLVGLDAELPEGIEGGSLGGVLYSGGQGEIRRRREEVVWHFPHYSHRKGTAPHSAIRVGDYKLIKYYETDELRLFDLNDDISETRDLSQTESARASGLLRRLEAYLDAIAAPMPRPNPAYRVPE